MNLGTLLTSNYVVKPRLLKKLYFNAKPGSELSAILDFVVMGSSDHVADISIVFSDPQNPQTDKLSRLMPFYTDLRGNRKSAGRHFENPDFPENAQGLQLCT